MEQIHKWLWQHKEYPLFTYSDSGSLNTLLLKVSRTTGKLEGVISALNGKSINTIVMDAAIDEIVKSSEIEGEILSRDSVRSSIRKKLDKTFDFSDDSSSRHTDGLVTLLLDSSYNDKPLTIERLHGWHSILFPTGYSDGYKIAVATYRNDDMHVISNHGYREKVHYVAPPPNVLEEEMHGLLHYVNHAKENPYIKSAIVHLWFVTIHPYDDGNGRIARAMTNYVLSRELGLDHKYYSLSLAIRLERKAYYDVLEKSQNLFYNRGFDFTLWVLWHIDMIQNAMQTALHQIETVIEKTKFWENARAYPLNKRELKVLNKILDKGIDNFEGGLSTKKYANIANTSIPTAKRDITSLLGYGLIVQVSGSAGRNTRYTIQVDKETKTK